MSTACRLVGTGRLGRRGLPGPVSYAANSSPRAFIAILTTPIYGKGGRCARASTVDRRQVPSARLRITIRLLLSKFLHTASARPWPSTASPSGGGGVGVDSTRPGDRHVPLARILAVSQTTTSFLPTYFSKDAVAVPSPLTARLSPGSSGAPLQLSRATGAQVLVLTSRRRTHAPMPRCPDAPMPRCPDAPMPFVHHDHVPGGVDADLGHVAECEILLSWFRPVPRQQLPAAPRARGGAAVGRVQTYLTDVALPVHKTVVHPDGDGSTGRVNGQVCLAGVLEAGVQHGSVSTRYPRLAGWRSSRVHDAGRPAVPVGLSSRSHACRSPGW